jgi:hypothetical protein
MFIVTFEGLCGFSQNGDRWDVHFAGGPHHHAGGTPHEHHPILMSRSLDFRWPENEQGVATTLMPDELVTIGNEQLALWHLKSDLVAEAPGVRDGSGQARRWSTSQGAMIDLRAAHPSARLNRTRFAGAVLGLIGGLLHPSSIRPEPLTLSRDAAGAMPVDSGLFAQTVEWSSMGGDVVFRAGDRTINFARNARLTVTNSAPDFDAIAHDHFGGYYELLTLAPGDTRLFLSHPVRFGGEAGNCPPGVILPS